MAGIRITWYPEPGTWHPCPIPTFQILTKHYRKTCQALKKSKESWAMTQSQTGRDPTGVRPVRCAQRAGIRIGSSQRNRRTERYRFLRRAGAWPNPFGPGSLQYDLAQLLGCWVNMVTERGLRLRIKERVLREAVPL
jgi:hypothetical protein